jgi:hypothetical protein
MDCIPTNWQTPYIPSYYGFPHLEFSYLSTSTFPGLMQSRRHVQQRLSRHNALHNMRISQADIANLSAYHMVLRRLVPTISFECVRYITMTVFSKKVWHIDITGMQHHFMSLMVADIKSIALFTVENSFSCCCCYYGGRFFL